MFDRMVFFVMENLPLQFVDSPNLHRITKLKPVSLKTLRRDWCLVQVLILSTSVVRTWGRIPLGQFLVAELNIQYPVKSLAPYLGGRRGWVPSDILRKFLQEVNLYNSFKHFVKTLRNNLLSLAKVMKEKVKASLPRKFVIVFDGWSDGTEYYIAVSAAFGRIAKSTGKAVPEQVMLSMRPLLADGIEGMTAVDHEQHIEKALSLYDRTCDNVLCIASDNCSVNRRMARILKVPLIGCASHKLKKANTLKLAANVRALTSYSCVRENVTRWSSTFQMISQFLKIQAELISTVKLQPMFPTHAEIEVLTRAHRSLKQFDRVTVMPLQKSTMSFIRSREIFDAVLQNFPQLTQYLAADADIVKSPLFEKSTVQMAKGLSLSNQEREAISGILMPISDCTATSEAEAVTDSSLGESAGEDEEEDYDNILEQRLKRQKTDTEDHRTYWNVEMITGTSVNCERHFSLAKHILTATRKQTTPAMFKALLILKVNRKWWDHHKVV